MGRRWLNKLRQSIRIAKTYTRQKKHKLSVLNSVSVNSKGEEQKLMKNTTDSSNLRQMAGIQTQPIFLALEFKEWKSEEAFALFKESADKGHIKAAVELGRFNEEERKFIKDINKAVRYDRISTDIGDMEGMQRLSNCYVKGKGLETNMEETRQLHVEISRKALEQSRGMEWMRDVDLARGFNERN